MRGSSKRQPEGATLEAIERVYRRDFERFATVAAAIVGSQAGARDAVQDAFATAVRKRRQFRRDGSLEGWLWRVVVNEAKTQRRRVAAREWAERNALVDQGHADGSDATDAGVSSLIASLPERQRLVVFLRYYADLSYEQIAEVIGVRRGTVAATLSNGHNALRLMLGEVS
jgi:RNA polymerase sigma-70 factor (ECF subfamily)